jgi:SOS regulatory protein LexA
MYETYKSRIVAFYKKHGRMPGYQEIMRLTGFKSKNAVFKLIEKMTEAGVVAKDARGHIVPRDIRQGVPLLGLVEAGFPSAAEEELLDVMNFDEFLVPNKESTYILKVKGDSMIEAGIHPGDMVIVERKATYKPGQIVVASIDNEFTMKYLRKKDGKFYLEPANPKYKPIYPSETFRVEAVVTAVVRKY